MDGWMDGAKFLCFVLFCSVLFYSLNLPGYLGLEEREAGRKGLNDD